jgi:glutathione S-transferase
VRTILNLKKIKYEIIAVHLVKADQKSNEYLQLNPSGMVPALFINNSLLTESMAIAEYLEEVYLGEEHMSLLPKDPVQKAKVRAVCEHVNAGMQPL